VKEIADETHSYEVCQAADQLSRAMIRARARRQPFVLIEVDIFGNPTIVRPRMWDSNFFRPKRSNEK